MLMIREHQMDAISAQVERQFELELVRQVQALAKAFQLTENGPADEEESTTFVQDTLELGASYGLELEANFESFISIKLALDQLDASDAIDQNDNFAWIEAILKRDDLPGNVKLFLIENQLREQAGEDKQAADICAMLDFVDANRSDS